jgi:hypothetical protein
VRVLATMVTAVLVTLSVSTGAASASPAIGHALDIGFAVVRDGDTVKGSGSYTNNDGYYKSVLLATEKWDNGDWQPVGVATADDSPSGSRSLNVQLVAAASGRYRNEIFGQRTSDGGYDKKQSNTVSVR